MFEVSISVFRVQGSGFSGYGVSNIRGLGFRVQGSGFRCIRGSGFGVRVFQGSGFGVSVYSGFTVSR